MILLADIGNTRIKLATAHGSDVQALATLVHADRDPDAEISAVLAQSGRPESVWISEVARASVGDRLASAVRSRYGNLPIRRPRSRAQWLGVRNAYAEPARLGVDRMLAMIAARALERGAALVVGAGTALTMDALSEDGTHLGGSIVPGPELMQRAVVARTARIEQRVAGRVAAFGSSTEDGLASGAWGAAAGLVERGWRALRDHPGGAFTVWMTGGDADHLAGMLPFPVRLEPRLVLIGLARAAADPETRSEPD